MPTKPIPRSGLSKQSKIIYGVAAGTVVAAGLYVYTQNGAGAALLKGDSKTDAGYTCLNKKTDNIAIEKDGKYYQGTWVASTGMKDDPLLVQKGGNLWVSDGVRHNTAEEAWRVIEDRQKKILYKTSFVVHQDTDGKFIVMEYLLTRGVNEGKPVTVNQDDELYTYGYPEDTSNIHIYRLKGKLNGHLQTNAVVWQGENISQQKNDVQRVLCQGGKYLLDVVNSNDMQVVPKFASPQKG
jgi:hypothetical protein